MQKRPVSVSFVISAASKTALYQMSADEIALRLKAQGFSVFKGFRHISQGSFPQKLQLPKLNFHDYFSNQPALILDSDVYIVMPHDLSTLSGLSGLLSREEHAKRQSLIILTPRNFWSGLLKWFEDVVLKNEMASSEVVNKVNLVDSSEEIIRLILAFRQQLLHSE